jgi:hypothetical protein
MQPLSHFVEYDDPIMYDLRITADGCRRSIQLPLLFNGHTPSLKHFFIRVTVNDTTFRRLRSKFSPFGTRNSFRRFSVIGCSWGSDDLSDGPERAGHTVRNILSHVALPKSANLIIQVVSEYQNVTIQAFPRSIAHLQNTQGIE